ncbi:hypothetical protein DL93DRAFT_2094687 [Clavulina sp. PMI_390]|nr:hypothetical protein DL93DRAFT_2094687 [Clavulina sp. PMI_390]
MPLIQATFALRGKLTRPRKGGKDFFSKLPTEILLLIVEELGIESYEEPGPLHCISRLNRRLNMFTQRFLWRSFFIGPTLKSKKTRVGMVIHEQIEALLRDSQRAAYVRHLTIEPVFADAAFILKIPAILSIVPNLTKLNLYISQTSPEIARLTDAFSRALGHGLYPMSFRLEELECEASLFDSSPGIYRFLLAQPSIRRLIVRRIPRGAPFWSAPSPIALRAEVEMFDEAGGSLLPSIEEFRGPASYASLVLHGTKHSLESIMLYTPKIDRDLFKCRLHYCQRHGRDISYWPFPCKPHPYTHLSDLSPEHLTSAHWLSIWADQPTPHLPSILAWAYAIDPSSLRFLRFGCLHGHGTVIANMTEFPFKVLCELSALEELEWLIFPRGGLSEEPDRVFTVLSARETVTEFLYKVIRESTPGRLSRIEFFVSTKHHLQIVRVQSNFGTLDVIGEQGQEQVEYLELLDGSDWKVWISTVSMEETDFYPLKPSALVGL